MNKNILNIIFYPLSLIYGFVTAFRNWLFDIDLLRSEGFKTPIISVGNLSVGGSGKTPHVEFLLSKFEEEYKMAVLSRGYKRKTNGFFLADEKSNNLILGDEPFQIYQKYPTVAVAVDEKRVHGVRKLQEIVHDIQLILLDDAFQHRQIRPGFSILLTEHNHLYCRDKMLPAGRLREWKSGSKRADIIVVTKCPEDLKPIDMRLVETELKVETNQHLYFSTYVYQDLVPVFSTANTAKRTFEELKENGTGVLLVAGIVSPESIATQLRKFTDKVETLYFDDHHAFNQKDFNLIKKRFESLEAAEKIVVLTEKDAARLIKNTLFPEAFKAFTFAIPIKVEILNNQEDSFIQKIKSYVAENSRNS